MHPPREASCCLSCRFLRPRGDAPKRRRWRRRKGRVPPPTRRCTGRRRQALDPVAGSSAHAEMHLRSHPSQVGGSRFLRPRGDAPVPSISNWSPIAVPPPTRRCTRMAKGRATAQKGSSAHAEMHPRAVYETDVETGFLRPRGDAPRRAGRRVDNGGVPPPTRRCTRWRPMIARGASGSSAHAEMHLSPLISSATEIRFLRPRGDAPLFARASHCLARVPPPTWKRSSRSAGSRSREARGDRRFLAVGFG